MARTPRWEIGDFKDGVQTIILSSWKYFYDFLKDRDHLEKRTYIYRAKRQFMAC